MNNLTKLYRDIVIVFGVGILLVLVIFLGIIPWAESLGKPAYLDISVGEGVSVEIDGKTYRNGVYGVEPGEYKAKVSGDKVSAKALDLNLVQNQTTGVYFELRNGELKEYTVEELAHRKGIAGVMPIEFALCGENATRMNCDAVRVTYEQACKGKECIVITGRKVELTEETLDRVRAELGDKGYDLNDYQYIYIQNSNR